MPHLAVFHLTGPGLVLLLVVYSGAFLRERWRAFQTRNWPVAEGAVLSHRVVGTVLAEASVVYKYNVNGADRQGAFSRRFLGNLWAEDFDRVQGASIQVRFDPENPDRSYAQIPRSFGGYFAPISALVLIVAVLSDPDVMATHQRISKSVWQQLDVPGALSVRVPGIASPTSKLVGGTAIPDVRPTSKAWVISANGGYFYVAILTYPAGTTIGGEVLERFPDAIHEETGNRKASAAGELTLDGRKGREFNLTHPAGTLRVYTGTNALYVLETDWDVPSDVRAFFGSLRFE